MECSWTHRGLGASAGCTPDSSHGRASEEAEGRGRKLKEPDPVKAAGAAGGAQTCALGRVPARPQRAPGTGTRSASRGAAAGRAAIAGRA